jgi:ribosomal protein S18 acetylase RimI-like enzyme
MKQPERSAVGEEAMASLGALIHSQATLRKLVQLDLPQLVRIEEHTPAPHRTRQDFLTAFQTGRGAVAEVNGQTVGFVIYQVTLPLDGMGLGALKKLVRWCLPPRQGAQMPPRHVGLLHIAVLPEWHRRGIGRALLEKIHETICQSGDDIQATVPETNLPAQLFLRDAGYKAVRVVPGCFGSEDGYVMQRING